MSDREPIRPFRSREWFDAPGREDMAALYLERMMNYGMTSAELRSGRPIIGIAQSGSDLSPCNRIHLELAQRVREGIRDAGGIALEFPTHPIQETCRRPTAAIDRNLSFMTLVEILYGYPIDAVVLTTGCDKTTPAAIMAASTVDIPAIVLSSGPMLDGWHEGELAGSGTVIWRARRKLAAGEITKDEFMEAACASAPSAGHCNTMGTASTMNAVAEALGMSLPGCSAIPAPYRERGQIAYETGKRIVEMAYEDLTPSKDPDARLIPQCNRDGGGDRRLDQRPAAHRGDGAPRGGGTVRDGLEFRLRYPPARQHAARWKISRRALSPSGRRSGGAVRIADSRTVRRQCAVRQRKNDGREHQGPRNARS